MKNIQTILFLAFMLLSMSCSMSPCGTKEGFIKKHEKFISKTIENSKDFNDSDWEKKDEEFKDLIEKCYDEHKEEFTSVEKREFWELNSQYYMVKLKDDIDLDDIGLEINRFIQEDLKVHIKEIEAEIKEVFDDEFKEDLKKSAEVLKDGIREIGEELKEIFNDKTK